MTIDEAIATLQARKDTDPGADVAIVDNGLVTADTGRPATRPAIDTTPVYIQHRVVSCKVNVSVVRADNPAQAALATDGERLGYYMDDGPEVNPRPKLYGPYADADEAKAAPEAWVEDV